MTLEFLDRQVSKSFLMLVYTERSEQILYQSLSIILSWVVHKHSNFLRHLEQGHHTEK